MNTVLLPKAAALLLLAMSMTACAKIPADGNPFRQHSPYSALPYADNNGVHVLATGELQYND